MNHWQALIDFLNLILPPIATALLGYAGKQLRDLKKYMKRVDKHGRTLYGEEDVSKGIVDELEHQQERIKELQDRVQALGYGRSASRSENDD